MALFPSTKEVLAPGQGSLAETPFPLLLHALFVEERTCALALKHNALEKRIHLEEGVPVGCSSNLLHETLGKFLENEGKLTAAQAHEALAASAAEGKPLGEVLIAQGRLAPFELFRGLQKNLAYKILDCFTWTSGAWRLEAEANAVETPLKVNPAQLVLTGCASAVPFDQIAAGLAFFDEQRFAVSSTPPHELSALKLSTKDSKLLAVLRERPTFQELCARASLGTEEAMRRLFAFSILGFVSFAEEQPEPTAPTLEPSPSAEVPAPVRPAAELEAQREEVMGLFLRHRGLDAFELLGVSEQVSFAELRKAYLGFCARVAPWQFSEGDAQVAEKAEPLFLAAARAFAELADPERKSQALTRRRNAAEARKRRPSGADFKIQTQLLDADAQFEAGKRLLDEGNPRGALQQFEYATEIEPRRMLFKAWLGWSRYLSDPARAGRLALQELAVATSTDPACAEAHFFEGEIRAAQGDLEGADQALRRAIKLIPSRPEFTEALRRVGQLMRGAR